MRGTVTTMRSPTSRWRLYDHCHCVCACVWATKVFFFATPLGRGGFFFSYLLATVPLSVPPWTAWVRCSASRSFPLRTAALGSRLGTTSPSSLFLSATVSPTVMQRLPVRNWVCRTPEGTCSCPSFSDRVLVPTGIVRWRRHPTRDLVDFDLSQPHPPFFSLRYNSAVWHLCAARAQLWV